MRMIFTDKHNEYSSVQGKLKFNKKFAFVKIMHILCNRCSRDILGFPLDYTVALEDNQIPFSCSSSRRNGKATLIDRQSNKEQIQAQKELRDNIIVTLTRMSGKITENIRCSKTL